MKRILCCVLALGLLLGCCTLCVAAEGNVAVTVADITWDGDQQPKPNASVVFSVHLKNSGAADVAKGAAVKITLYLNENVLFTQNYDKGIPAGETVAVKLPKWKAVEGEHVVTAVLNDTVPTKANWVDNQHLAANIRVADTALEVPAIAEKYGMTNLTFSDDFTTLDRVDKETTSAYGYKWYTERPYGQSNLLPSDYELTEDGLLLHMVDTKYDIGMLTFDNTTGTGWGFTHGYMEMRVRFSPERVIEGSRGEPSVWSLPPERLMGLSGYDHFVETDFLEYWGDNLFSTTLHDQSFKYTPEREYVHWYKNSNNEVQGMGDGEWHTMGFVWRKGSLVCYLDGKEYMATYWDEEKKSYPEAKLQNFGDGSGAFSQLDNQLTPLIISGAEGWPLEIDYLNVWQGDDEANQGEGVEVAQFMDMYLRDGDGQVQLTADFENYEALIEAKTAFEELPAEQKEQLDRLAKREVGKTMAQALNGAEQFKNDLDTFVATYAVDSEGNVLATDALEACQVIVKGERQWKKMDAALKEAVNAQMLLSGGSSYDDMLAAAREKVPASPIKAWMIAVAAVVVVAAGVAIVIGVLCKKRNKKVTEE